MARLLYPARALCRLRTDLLSVSCYGTGHQQEQAPQRRYVPRRALMYVPGDDPRKIKKAEGLAADCLVLDCEDGVALSRKEAARSSIRATLQSGALSAASRREVAVRVNSVESGLCRDDLQAVLASDTPLPECLLLPKVEDIQQLDWFAEEVHQLLQGRLPVTPLRLVLFCESGRSILALPELCRHGLKMTQGCPLQLDGWVFGSDDFCADIGATRSSAASELLFARQHFVTAVKTHGLQAIDIVYIDYKDLQGLERQSIEGASFGFTGKQVIHPGQVSIVQAAFSPSQDRVTWATELLQAFELHQQQGKGAFTFRGSMIDMPLVLQARNILQLVDDTG